MQKSIVYLASFLVIFSSCVTSKVHNALIAEHEATKSALNIQEQKALKLQSEVEELQAKVSSLQVKITKLVNDSVQNGDALTVLQNKYDALSESYDFLTSKNSREMSDKAKETKQLLEQLEQAQSALFAKEDQLNKLSASLDARSSRVAELESIINKKDSIVTALKQSISKALTGLEGDGLTIEQRDGKVYISLEEALLFASGKYEVSSGGVAALNKLATALAAQKDLKILVEGHTDNIPLAGKGVVTDNWDLSVMRATNVVKVLTKNPSLNPLQLTAAGRAEFVPIASNETAQGRSSNRRIEMILSPDLDDLFKLIEE